MKPRIIIQVTQADIDNGQKCDTSQCPIALSVARNLGLTRDNVSVGMASFDIFGSDEELAPSSGHYLMTDRAHDFVRDFDSSRPVKPFRFTAVRV